MLTHDVVKAAQEHARSEFPKEACGLVVADTYFPCRNIAADPEQDFAVHPQDYANAVKNGKLQMVIHSHPNGPLFPTRTDMEQQVKMKLPWAIVPLDEERIGAPIVWGADKRPAIIGREFVHGITDCYSLIRDVFAAGKDELAKQEIDWPLAPINLPEVPRDDEWWAQDDQDLYADHFEKFGFKKISFNEAQPGDVFLVKIKSDKINHGGVLLANNLIAQHFPGRLSRREPAGIWARYADLWIRYIGDKSQVTDA
jgi:proteasome lid subunit RPN8/RPN11